MNQRLLSSQRIKDRREFQRIFDHGQFAKGRLLNIWVYHDYSPESRPKLGLIVSRKSAIRAVKRNVWRRRIRECFRKRQHLIKMGVAVLVQARYHREVPSYSAIESELTKLLGKAKVYDY